MKKQIISLLLAFATLFNVFVGTVLPAFADGSSSPEEEEPTANVQQIKESVTAAGYSVEYDLFTGLMDAYFSEDEILSLYSLSSDDFTQILKWMRKYIENGKVNGYSETSAAETFMDWERYFILDYFVNGIYGTGKDTEIGSFVRDLPDSYWFRNPEDLPDTLTFSVQYNLATSADDIKWVVVGSSQDHFQNYVNEIPYQITANGLTSELTLSAEDLLNLTSPVCDYTGIYQPDTVTVYAVCNGQISNICYVTVGGEVAPIQGAFYGAVGDGEVSVSLNNPGNLDLTYLWNYNSNPDMGYVSEYNLRMEGYWEFPESSNEESLTAANTDGFDNLSYVRCSVSYSDWEGTTHLISLPLMPVLSGTVSGGNSLEEHLYTPVTHFIEGSGDGCLEPGSEVTYRFFTLADCTEYHTEWDSLSSDEVVVGEGQTFRIPAEWAKQRTEYDVTAHATAPSGQDYYSYIDRIDVMYEEEAYLWKSSRPLNTKIWDRQIVVGAGETSVEILTLPNSTVYSNGTIFSIDGWGKSKLTVRFYTNTVASYENATDAGTGSFRLNLGEGGLTENRDLFYFFLFQNKAGDVVYTSPIYQLGLHTESSVTAESLFYVTEDGTLYAVLSSASEITVPASVGGIAVRNIASNAFQYCDNLITVNLPASVESVEEYAFSTNAYLLKNIRFSEGILRIEDGAFPSNLETVNLPSTLTYVGDFPNNKMKEVSIALKNACVFEDSYGYELSITAEKVVFEEGLTVIGEGSWDWAIEADEVVFPSTLKTLAPRAEWSVGTVNFPEGLETIDFGGVLESGMYGVLYHCSAELGMTEIRIPESVTNLGSLGRLPNVEKITIPDTLALPNCLFADSAISSYTFPVGTTAIPDGFFLGSQIETIVIPEGVTEIGAYAFASSAIRTIVLPSTLKKIGDGAFADSQIESVVLPDSVTSLGTALFSGCSNLNSVTLSKRMTSIPADFFCNCSSLTEITLPKGLSQIGSFAFAYSGLSGCLTLPAGLLKIGSHAFEETCLSDVILPENLTDIGAYAFANVPLEHLDIPASVLRIGNYAFAAYAEWGDPSLKIPYTEINGMEGVRFLGQYAFAYSSITSFALPSSLKQLHKGLISGTDITVLDLQSEILTFIGDYAFLGTGLVSLTVPSSVKTIGNGICKDCYDLQSAILPSLSYARLPAEIFSGCENLTSVTIPDGITAIGDYAFNQCRSLDNLVLSDTIRTIGQYAFCGCESLSTVTVPNRLIAVYDYAFAGTPVSEASFSSDLRLIGEGAFENCSSLASVTFEEGVVSIGARAFAGCTSLTALEIPDTATSVGSDFIADSGVETLYLSATLYGMPRFAGNTVIREIVCESPNLWTISQGTFEGCTSLETCIIGSAVEIGASAFKDCILLQSFVAPSTVTEIGTDAFAGCISLVSFLCGGDESELETIYSRAFYGCSALTYCEMGNAVQTIYSSAYEGCVSLEKLDLSPALKKIGSCAFRSSGIKSLVIGRYVRDINVGYVDSFVSYERKKSCFYDMPCLETVVFLDQIIDVLSIEDAFLYDPMLTTVYLPSSVGGMWAANGISPTYSLFRQTTDDYGNPAFGGIDIETLKANYDKVPIADDYYAALLPGYVGTTYIRYGNYDPTKDRTNTVYYSVYKPTDRFVVLAFAGDYDEAVDYYSGFGPALQKQHDDYDSSIPVPTLSDFVVGMNVLSDYSVRIMAGDEDITDEVEIEWYINWLGDNVLTDGSSLRGFAWTYSAFEYRFTVRLSADYAFDFKDFDSDWFTLVSSDDGKTRIVNLEARPKSTVRITLPDEVKEIATLTVMQTVDGLVRPLDSTAVDGVVTVEASRDSNLLIYCTADGYYRYTGGIDSYLLASDYDFTFSVKPLPKSSSFRAKFHILDILPDDMAEGGIKEQLTELGSFAHISAKVTNKTSGVETTDLSLEYPYIVIENYESFYTEGDELEITLIPDADADFYGLSATLLPGSGDFGSTEGTMNGYAIVYFTPTLAEDATSGKVVVQAYNLLGDRVSSDIVSSGEMLVRRFKNGAYRLTAFEQNNFIGEMDKLSTFASIGWTEDEYFYTDLFLEAPFGQSVKAEVPAAPNADNLLKTKPTVTKTDAEYYQPAQTGTPARIEEVGEYRVLIPGDPFAVCDECWYWTSNLSFQSELDSFGVKNAELILTAPAPYALNGFYRLTHLGYEEVYVKTRTGSADGETVTYTFDASFLETDPAIDFFVSFEATDKTPIETLQSVGLFSLSLKCDATLEEETKTVYIGLGSVSAVNKYLLESTIGILHAETVSSKTGIPVEVQAPPFSDIELYADGVLVATGKTNYTGSATLKYDAPFAWLWWQYDVYAVISFANTRFQTASRTVTCHVSTIRPTEVKTEISIIDTQTGKVVFPTVGDDRNVVSVQYETGDRKNVAIRQSLVEGKTYRVVRSYSASFNTPSETATGNVAILADFINRNNMTEEEILWAEYDSATGTYRVEASDEFVYNPAEMLYDLKIPTELGVQWDNLAEADVILLPGQLAAMREREAGDFADVPFTDAIISALNGETAKDPLFVYYPAAMQADLLQTESIILEYCNDTQAIFESAFGLTAADFTEADIAELCKGTVSDTFVPTAELAASLREQDYLEYPILGQDAGLFLLNSGDTYDVYDFSDGYHFHYSATLLLDMILEKTEAKAQETQNLLQSIPKMEGSSGSRVDYATKFPMIRIYDSVLFAKLSLLNELEPYAYPGNSFDTEIMKVYFGFLTTCNEYEETLAKVHGTLMEFIEFEAKYGHDFYESVLKDSALMNALDYMNGVLGDTIACALDAANIHIEAGDRLINQFYEESTGKFILDVNTEMANQSGGDVQVGVMATGVKTAAMTLGDKVTESIIDANTSLDILTQYNIQDEAAANILKAQNIMKHNGSVTFVQDYGLPDNEITQFIENSTAYKNGEIVLQKTVSQTQIIPANNQIGGEGLSRVKSTYTYRASNSKSTKNALNIVIDAENNVIGVSQATVTGIKASNTAAKSVGKAAGKAVEVVALVDTVTSMYKDMEGQFNAIDNLFPSYAKVMHSLADYLDVYTEYLDMYQKIKNKADDRESFTLLPSLDYNTFLDMYDNIDIRFDSTEMNKHTFAKLYDGQAYYWSVPTTVASQSYIDPDTGNKVKFVGYFPCNMSTLLRIPVKKVYYDDIAGEGAKYAKTVENCMIQAGATMTAIENLAKEYRKAVLWEMDIILGSVVEMLPAVGLVGTGIKGIRSAVNSVNGLNYLTMQDVVISKVGIMDDYETTLVIQRKRIQRRLDGFTSYTELLGKRYPVTYITYNTAKERWYDLCRNHWTYTYYFEDEDGNLNGGSVETCLPNFPSGHPLGLTYELGYTGEVQLPDMSWTYFSYCVDNNGILRGWSLEDYGLKESEAYISRKYADDTVSVRWKTRCLDPQIDPAGYIYEAVLSNRVEGATVTLYTADSTGSEVQWDGTDYGEINPQITEDGGYYSWMTPSGLWKVRVEKEGYLPASSESNPNSVEGWLPVPPPQLDINIGLVSTLAPTISEVVGYNDGIQILFSQYMDIESFVGKVTLSVDGAPVDCVLTFTDREIAASGEDIYYGRTLVVSRLDGMPLSGDVTVSLDGGVKNYANTSLGETYTSPILALAPKAAVIELAQDSYNVANGKTISLTGKVTDAFGTAITDTEVSLSVSVGNAVLQNVLVYTDENGFFSFGVKGNGTGNSVVTLVCDTVEKSVQINTVEPMATLSLQTESSAMPTVTVTKPNGSTDIVTASGTIQIPEGSTLTFKSANGEAGYTVTVSEIDPWWCSDYVIAADPVIAAETTYRIVAKENDKNYSDVLILTVEFSTDEHVHTYGEWITDNPASCTEDGTKHRNCTGCTDVENGIIPALNHDFSNEYTVDTPASCSQVGSKSRHCSRCSATTDVTEIPKTTHTFGEWITDNPASCTADGTKHRNCSGCTAVENGTIPALNHDFSTEYTVDTPASCSQVGSKSRHCSHCSATTDVTEIPKTAHTFGEWITDNPASCTADGTKHRNCSGCTAVENGTIPALNHNFSNEYTVDTPASCSRVGSKSRHCSRCSTTTDVTEISKTAHEYGEWVVDTQPTYTEPGQRHRICIHCTDTETEEIAKLVRTVLESESVSIESEAGFENGVTLTVYVLTDTETASVRIENGEVRVVYDLHLEKENTTVQPNGKVKVKLPISEELRSLDRLAVYYIPENGEAQNMNAAMEGDFIVFETDHFSRYAIVREKTSEPPVIDPETPEESEGMPGWIIPAVVVFFVLAGAAVCFFVIRKKKK